MAITADARRQTVAGTWSMRPRDVLIRWPQSRRPRVLRLARMSVRTFVLTSLALSILPALAGYA